MVICEGFSVNNAAFTAYTILPFIACNLFCFVALAFQYRKQVPRTLTRVAHRDPRSALRDPVAAWVGSCMLGTTLILCLVVSFFGIDVWMISLPFAFSKFLFDLGWDWYRISRDIPIGLPEAEEEEESDESPAGPKQESLEDSLAHRSSITDVEKPQFPSHEATPVDSQPHSLAFKMDAQPSPAPETETKPTENGPPRHSSDRSESVPSRGTTTDESQRGILNAKTNMPNRLRALLNKRFPTFMTALPRLPFGLVPFAFSQFILIEALNHQGWVNIFGNWLVRASHSQVHPTIWLIGVLGVVLCNLSGTNIGATILLTQVVRAADLPYDANRAAAIALAVASNIGAVSFTFSASLAGLLWRSILEQKKVHVRQRDFAFWNLLPLLVMTTVGLGVVSAEMAVLFPSSS